MKRSTAARPALDAATSRAQNNRRSIRQECSAGSRSKAVCPKTMQLDAAVDIDHARLALRNVTAEVALMRDTVLDRYSGEPVDSQRWKEVRNPGVIGAA